MKLFNIQESFNHLLDNTNTVLSIYNVISYQKNPEINFNYKIILFIKCMSCIFC